MGERDEITRNEPRALVDQLIERMLPIGAGLAPENWTGIIGDLFSAERYMLAVTFHRELLKICREPFQILFVRKNGNRLRIKKVRVPNSKQTEENR